MGKDILRLSVQKESMKITVKPAAAHIFVVHSMIWRYILMRLREFFTHMRCGVEAIDDYNTGA